MRELDQAIIDGLFMTALLNGYDKKDLVGKRRFPELTRMRHLLMCRMRQTTTLSYAKIGKIFNRDHTTVIAACRKEL